MCDCCNSPDRSVAFFNTLSETWDSMHDLAVLSSRLDAGIKRFGVGPQEHLLDVGCGTGNLTAALLRSLSKQGSVTAIDISPRMIEAAQAKANNERVNWRCGPVEHLNISPGSFDRIFCFSVWPHLADPGAAARLFHRMLAPRGMLHIWHLISRQAVNKIHSEASEAVHDHLLAPAADTAALLEQAGFVVEETQDDDNEYLVTARKKG